MRYVTLALLGIAISCGARTGLESIRQKGTGGSSSATVSSSTASVSVSASSSSGSGGMTTSSSVSSSSSGTGGDCTTVGGPPAPLPVVNDNAITAFAVTANSIVYADGSIHAAGLNGSNDVVIVAEAALGLDADATHVVWLPDAASPNKNTIRGAPLVQGAAPTTLFDPVQDPDYPTFVYPPKLDGGDAYAFTARSLVGTLWHLPANNPPNPIGPHTQIYLHFTTDSGAAYGVDPRVQRMGFDGQVTKLYDFGVTWTEAVGGLASDGNDLFFSAGAERLWIVPACGALDDCPCSDDTGCVVDPHDGRLLSVPIHGGAPRTVATCFAYPTSVSVDATRVFVFDLGEPDAMGDVIDGAARVLEIDKASGTVTTIAAGLSAPRALVSYQGHAIGQNAIPSLLALSSDSVFVLTSQGIVRIAK